MKRKWLFYYKRLVLKFRIYDFITSPPLKFIHNQIVSNENKNKVMSKWLELEEELMKDVNFRTQGKIYCRNLFMEAVKREYK